MRDVTSGAYEFAQRAILGEVATTMAAVDGIQVEKLCNMIEDARRVFFIGVGRVMLSLEAMAKRLAHLGVDTVVVGQITEPAITRADLLIVGSGSGATVVPLGIAKKAHDLGVPVAHIGSCPNSPMSQFADHFVRIPAPSKLELPDETKSRQPMTSLFEQCLLLLGDAIALMMVYRNDLNLAELWHFHANLE